LKSNLKKATQLTLPLSTLDAKAKFNTETGLVCAELEQLSEK